MVKGLIRPHMSSLALMYKFIDAAQLFLTLYGSVLFNGAKFSSQWSIVGLVAVIMFLAYAEIFALYRPWRSSRYWAFVLATSASWAMTVASLVFLGYLFDAHQILNKEIVTTWMGFSLICLHSWRWIFRQFLFLLRRNNFNTRSAIILGATQSGVQLKEELDKNKHLGIKFLGFYDDRPEKRTMQEAYEVKVEGTCGDAVALAQKGMVDQVYIALPIYAKNRIDYILNLFSDSTATVHIIPNLYEYQLLHAQWDQVGAVTTLSIHDSPIKSFMGGYVKRLVDILLASFSLIVLFLPMLLIGAFIKITSKGPVIFAQKRYGLDGQQIDVYKFRTMTTMDNGNIVKQATLNDTRITPLGKFLRSNSLDELPQLFNVLQGAMSIVGPRPHAIAHNEEYRKIIRGYMLRHKVKPGLTGWAQVNGWRGQTETLDKMKHRVEYDLEYINKWSLSFDFKIILMTLFNGTLFNKNAY